MKKYLSRIHARLTEWVTQVLIRKIILPAVLTFTYFFILGPTSLMAKLFFSSSLAGPAGSRQSNWIDASANEEDAESSKKQS